MGEILDSKKKLPGKDGTAKFIIFLIISSILVGIFSLFMAGVASIRNDIAYDNYESVSNIYTPLEQSAPTLNALAEDSDFLFGRDIQIESYTLQKYVENTYLKATSGNVVINADFVKKGLVYQPSYETQFYATYTLVNTLDEPSIISFDFPFPVNTASSEISNAKLIVDGVEVENAKANISYYQEDYYGDYYYEQTDGLRWEGEVPANSEVLVEVSYDTVGLSLFRYEGIENTQGSQDFNFTVTINGTRAYDVNQGLSVDNREFGDKSVTLTWEKPDLYSRPLIDVEVGDKLNPSTQVSRVYLTMMPIYVIFMLIMHYLTKKFGKGVQIFDLFLISVLFVIYFPLVHYLSSFTVDPTIDVFAGLSSVATFSMPLYGAFFVSWALIGGLMYYFLGRTAGFKFATKFGIPTFVLFIGFFPLVVTVPEYSMLLVLIGFTAFTAIIIQLRVKMMDN
ncbi:hypothetical protein KC909_00790 [Candidatus Dojkabacteria bacterium]|uniref:Uncharacterized protein n=1 Tax=Candidatus Dojkabacteria bacterium TaxID=2099670 RepID=A0A955L4U5_9BACT|nr:hypothetical protein [Candidatus Dojkabacteria bacterium]